MNHSILMAACAALVLSACGGNQQQGTEESKAEATAVTAALTQVWKTDTSFTGSESTLYDPSGDVIYVSNGNNGSEKDNDGFIAVINTDGTVRDLKWVEGDLHAPKGMALLNGKLYVTDIDEVKIIDVASASIEKTIAVEGAEFLNDVATDRQQIYFSDTRAGNIYAMNLNGEYSIVSSGNANVNGLECYNGQLYSLDGEGLKKFSTDGEYTSEVINSEVTGGDGLVILNDSTFVVSRWHGEIFFVNGNETTVILDTQAEESNTADISFVPGKNLVIVPTFLKNEVAAYELSY